MPTARSTSRSKEFHPAFEEYCEAIWELREDEIDVIQARIAEQSKGLYDPKAMNPELWAQFLQGQAPVVQGLMGNYLEQSKSMFLQMQEQMAKQAETLFPGMAGFVPPKR